MSNYNYVLFDENKNEFYKLTLKDLYGHQNIRVFNPPMNDKNVFIRVLYKLHVTEHYNMPFKEFWNRYIFKDDFEEKRPLCFIFSSALITLRRLHYFEYLRKVYPGCKLVYFCRDLFGLYRQRYKCFDVDYVKKTFDLILHYDIAEVEKYGLTFYGDFESLVDISKYNSSKKSDVVFVGAAKDRLDTILSVYDYLIDNGVECDFSIYGAPDSIKEKYLGINFIDKWISYEDVLRKIANTKCILEVIQGSSAGYSARAMKAFGYNKKLISNSIAVKYLRFYDGKNVQFFNHAQDINIQEIKNNDSVDYNYKNEFSPLTMIDYLDNLLSKKTTTDEFFSEWFNIEQYRKEVVLKNGL